MHPPVTPSPVVPLIGIGLGVVIVAFSYWQFRKAKKMTPGDKERTKQNR